MTPPLFSRDLFFELVREYLTYGETWKLEHFIESSHKQAIDRVLDELGNPDHGIAIHDGGPFMYPELLSDKIESIRAKYLGPKMEEK